MDPPVEGLWHVGAPLENFEPRVAIVGARDATAYGLEIARSLASELAARGVCIVSGMARGIDTAAHRGALSVPYGTTLAVLAGGVDVPYPRSSKDVYREILERGAVVSENPPGTDNLKHEFVKRNRIVVALSDAVVIVQADERKSGAMKTAEIAGTKGRELLAVPGDVRSSLSSGPHQLLRLGARPCEGFADVLEAIGMPIGPSDGAAPMIPDGLADDDRKMLGAVLAGPASPDELAERAELDVVAAARALTRLELSGLIQRDNAGGYSYV